MKAADVIKPNRTTFYWDVPGTNRIVHQYSIIGTSIRYFEVIEPSSLSGPHSTIMSLRSEHGGMYYGTVVSRRSQSDPAAVRLECYRDVFAAIGVKELSDMGCVWTQGGRVEVYSD